MVDDQNPSRNRSQTPNITNSIAINSIANNIHITDEELTRFRADKLPIASVRQWRQHFIDCDECYDRYFSAVAASAEQSYMASASTQAPSQKWFPKLGYTVEWTALQQELQATLTQTQNKAKRLVESMHGFLAASTRSGNYATLSGARQFLHSSGSSRKVEYPVHILSASGTYEAEIWMADQIVTPKIDKDKHLIIALEFEPDPDYILLSGGCQIYISPDAPALMLHGELKPISDSKRVQLQITADNIYDRANVDLDIPADRIYFFLKSKRANGSTLDIAQRSDLAQPGNEIENGQSENGQSENGQSENGQSENNENVQNGWLNFAPTKELNQQVYIERQDLNREIHIQDTPDFRLTADRYAVYHLIPGWDVDLVRQSSALVLGTGALGNEVIKNLALMGIGKLIVVDFDTVDVDNLSRSVLFRREDAGQSKVEVIRKRVHEINPDVDVIAMHQDMRFLGQGLFRRVDLVMACVDSLAGRQWINSVCYSLGHTWIDGALGGENNPFDGYVHVFQPDRESACFECTLNAEQMAVMNQRRGCGLLAQKLQLQRKIPTTPTSASIIGALMAQEAFKLLHNNSRLANKRFYLPGATYETFLQEFPLREECLTHAASPGIEIIELPQCSATSSVMELLNLATQHGAGINPTLQLDTDFILRVRCLVCQTPYRQVGKTIDHLAPDERECATCQAPLESDSVYQITQSSMLANRRLADLGVPPLAIVNIADVNGKFYSFELTGDAATLFPNQETKR